MTNTAAAAPVGHMEERRLACQIYTQLPEERDEALRVLAYVRQIMEWPEPAPHSIAVWSAAKVVSLFSDEPSTEVG